jgi:hypothetical protein
LKLFFTLVKKGADWIVRKATALFAAVGDAITGAINNAGEWINKNLVDPINNFVKGQCTCPSGYEQSGLLCYPVCKDGFYGLLNRCIPNCPQGFRNEGDYCYKPDSYGRGSGYAVWNSDKCKNQNPQGCEKWGLMYYPLCQQNFHNVSCCICSPDCPQGMSDIGISCYKSQIYGRGAGALTLNCSSTTTQPADITTALNNLKIFQDLQQKDTDTLTNALDKEMTSFRQTQKTSMDDFVAKQKKIIQDLVDSHTASINKEKDTNKQKQLQQQFSDEEHWANDRFKKSVNDFLHQQKQEMSTKVQEQLQKMQDLRLKQQKDLDAKKKELKLTKRRRFK